MASPPPGSLDVPRACLGRPQPRLLLKLSPEAGRVGASCLASDPVSPGGGSCEVGWKKGSCSQNQRLELLL